MKLFLGDKCWDKLFELPKNVQLRVRDFQKKFKENPKSAAINLEKIQDFKDNSLRTARIDDTYRAIIGVASDDIYCLLWIDHHDEAMEWARNKRFDWNSYTNSFQVTTVAVEETKAAAPSPEVETAFTKYSDEQLLRIGVPEHQLSIVKGIRDLDDLDKVEPLLSSDVFENLFYLMEDGASIDSIITEIEAGKAAYNGNPAYDTREARSIRKFERELQARGASTYLHFQYGGRHCEADWEKQNPVYMNFLWY